MILYLVWACRNYYIVWACRNYYTINIVLPPACAPSKFYNEWRISSTSDRRSWIFSFSSTERFAISLVKVFFSWFAIFTIFLLIKIFCEVGEVGVLLPMVFKSKMGNDL